MCQILETHICKSPMYDVMKSCMGEKNLFKLYNKPVSFNSTECPYFTYIISDATFQPLRKYHLSNFSEVLRKNIHNYLKSY